jgi:predicted transglutaminase-like cysteine proteinase
MNPTRRSFLQPLATASVAARVPKSSALPKVSGSEVHDDICSMGATDMAALIRQKKLSAVDVMQAHLRRIERINSKVNAIVTEVPEDQLLPQARAADEALAKEAVLGGLHGLP